MTRLGPVRFGRKSSSSRRRAAMRGFTLMEALVATALMGVVLAALAAITAQWLPNWNRGIARVQRSELLSVSLHRLIADLEAALARLDHVAKCRHAVAWGDAYN